jgi:hypothetical protein
MLALTELSILDLLLDLVKNGGIVLLEPFIMLSRRREESKFWVSIRNFDLT